MSPTSLARSAKGTRILGHPLMFLEEAPSTNDVALDLAQGGAAEGMMVIANTQLRGRGRFGREWLSAPGAGFWFSLLLRPGLGYPQSGLLPVAIGAGIVLALRDIGLQAALKWPNDILVRGRKVAGILVEGRSQGDRLKVAVAGIGINWLSPESGGGRLATPATGLADELAQLPEEEPSPEELLGRVLEGVEKTYLLLKSIGPAPFLAAWPGLSAHMGRPVIVEETERPGIPAPREGEASRSGWAMAGPLLADGSLEVTTSSGKRFSLTSTEVRLWSSR